MRQIDKISFLELLICLVPISLILGIFVTELLVFLILIFFIYKCISDRKFKYFKSNFFKIFLIIYAFLVLNSIFSENILISLKTSLPYIRYGILSLAIWYVLDENRNFFYYFKFFLVFPLAFLAFDGFFQYIYGNNITGYSTQSSRLSSFFFDEWILGSFLQKFFPLLVLTLFINQKTLKYRNIKLFFLFFTYLIVFFSGERAAFFLLTFYLLIILIPLLLTNIKTIRILYFFIPILLLLVFLSPMKNRVFLVNPEMSFKSSIMNFYNLNYDTYLQTSINIFSDHKIIGSGVKTYRIMCKEYYDIDPIKSCSTHPHNYYIQVLAECGCFGFLILIVILIYLIVNYIRLITQIKQSLKKNYFKIIILSGLIVFLWPFTTTGSLFNNFISIILFFNIGFYLQNLNGKQQGNVI